MFIDPITFIFITVAVLVLAVLLVFLVINFTKISHELHDLQKANANMQIQLAEKPISLLEKANVQAQEIISQANKHAAEIIASSKTYGDVSNDAMKAKLAELEKQQEGIFTKASDEMKTAYQNMLTQIQEEDITTLKSMTKDIQSDILADFKEFRDSLERETINSEKVVKEKIDEEYLEIEKELQEYKKKKFQEVDEDIYKILYRVSEMVLSQGIPFDKHKQLVVEALETAKKEQVFK